MLPLGVRTVRLLNSVAMDKTVLEVDTEELVPRQGRVVGAATDMGTLEVADMRWAP